MFWNVVGMSAAFLTMFSFVPQIFKAVKTRSVKDVSIITLIQMSLGVTLWAAYGIHLRNAIIIIANFFTLLTTLILLSLYFVFRKKI
ncbi:MAG: SemiSWEET family transporter [Candidatus Omnitrophica bacterium]|nr:SemiSWEET family transporter [Candidatus Omnitrophota bacterium]